jgi:hypothetical protein
MAAGFRSPFFIWVGGLSAPGGSGPEPPDPNPTGCICPSYTRDGSLTNNWVSDTCNVSRASLPYTIPIFRLYILGPITISYKIPATLVNAWTRGACE